MSRSSSNSQTRRNLPAPSARIRIANDKHIERDREGPIPSSLSLLSARRPSWAPPLYDHPQDTISAGLASYRDVPSFGMSNQGGARSQPSSSPEDGGNFRRSLQIDMKDLVGDAVGNMSISPASRDIVLAARRGLFIIDLEAPLEIPRFLPQGGTWDVADVQWNPHRLRAEYIVSTSSEKLLIWNLMMVGKTSIEHILHSHYRAITDINWHTSEPDTVCSVGIDSWLWTWDLREPRKPVLGLCAFNAGGTQVKWNRQDPNVLASSHMDEVLIWDRRKGSLPTARIRAHNAKIYGIDWAHARVHDLVTCSLDKTIKVWNVHEASAFPHSSHPQAHTNHPQPVTTITTTYPVWRARNLPFGRGVLSLPQRGETALEMWAEGNEDTPVEVFEGHTDVVKEFVWRKGGLEGGEYQLITWSKDRTLRFWPVDSEIMEKTGHVPGSTNPPTQQSRFFADFGRPHQSFRHPPEGSQGTPALSAPVGSRGILAEVRAGGVGAGAGGKKMVNPVLQPHGGSAARGKGILLLDSGAGAGSGMYVRHPQLEGEKHARDQNAVPARGHAQVAAHGQLQSQGRVHHPVPIPGSTMSRGHVGGGKGPRVGMDAFTWLASVRVGERREGSEGRDSGVSSGSRSRASPARDGEGREGDGVSGQGGLGQGTKRKRSESRLREGKEGEGSQSLPDEITSVLTKLATSKIRLEKHELTKKRTCTLGLHGPWGESSSVFIRVSFRFPKTYPYALHPDGTPEIELERSPLISMQNRAFMLRRLRTIREKRRPCLEACLRFLLFGDENEQVGIPVGMGSDSSEDEAQDGEGGGEGKAGARKSRDFTVSLLRNNKNLAEPRTSQGVFGPNGELVCFFRAPPRIVRHHQVGGGSDISASPAAASRSSQSSSRFFQSPALLSDAVRRLGLAATDQRSDTVDSRRPGDSDNTLRIMTNLLTFSQQKAARDSGSDSKGDINNGNNVALIPTRRSTVLIRVPTDVSFARRKVAAEYVFEAATLAELCGANASIAREHGQFAHERVFRMLQSLFPVPEEGGMSDVFGIVARQIIDKLHKEFCESHDVQMLAMISVVLLKAYISSTGQPTTRTPSVKEPSPAVSKNEGDYFSLLRPKDPRAAVLSPGWPRLPSTSPTATNYPAGSSLSTSNSSRGSWSSLFNTGSVRQFMSGVHESISTPLDTLPPRLSVPMPGGDGMLRLPNPDSPRRKNGRDQSNSTASPISKSWSETQMAPLNRPSPFSSAGHGRRLTFSQVISPRQIIQEKKLIIIEEESDGKEAARPKLEAGQLAQFACHILAYADVLFSWQLLNKRLELLNAVKTSTFVRTPPQKMDMSFDIQPACGRCGRGQSSDDESCSMCGNRPTRPSCSICRLPVKGLSRSCGECMHITHLKCWRDNKSDICGTGCGCRCSGFSTGPRRSSIIHSPVSPPSLL
ncbi:hypothetical protein HYDPIDRAFT_112664 [Hydnomerulius pinastri MD-312]|uniref:WDR59/RTC1-like RING zinc finger domain-containing protein n=1 Tax=Hydnomerulius pinastri MD-312 TaxID=994086 RepID=A0A0C9W910_9AGAM|nr:hypothetical protein HYDPIDRAFT_112664 [Hydnomerulius pinastri MD-312]